MRRCHLLHYKRTMSLDWLSRRDSGPVLSVVADCLHLRVAFIVYTFALSETKAKGLQECRKRWPLPFQHEYRGTWVTLEQSRKIFQLP